MPSPAPTTIAAALDNTLYLSATLRDFSGETKSMRINLPLDTAGLSVAPQLTVGDMISDAAQMLAQIAGESRATVVRVAVGFESQELDGPSAEVTPYATTSTIVALVMSVGQSPAQNFKVELPAPDAERIFGSLTADVVATEQAAGQAVFVPPGSQAILEAVQAWYRKITGVAQLEVDAVRGTRSDRSRRYG